MSDALDNLKGNLGGPQTGPAAGTSNTVGTTYLNVFTPQQAATAVTELIKKFLKRTPTQDDIKYWVPKIIAAQKKNPGQQFVTKDDITGNSVVKQVPGLDETVWFESSLKKSKQYKTEFSKVQKRSDNALIQEIQGFAADNGIVPSDRQLKVWTDRLNAGEKADVIKAAIRDQAGLGQPDSVKKLLGQGTDLNTIYSPYRDVMAKVLEVNPDAIKLDDPVLRSAIRPEGEMSIYDFQRELRKDPRWQYTDNAREEVSSSIMGVLKDFGFKG